MTPFKFAFITDTHLYPEAPQNFAGGLQQQEKSYALYEKLIEQLNAFDPAFVVHGGDIVCGGQSFDMSAEEYVVALNIAHSLGEKLNMPCYYIPGNHDLNPETGTKEMYIERFGINGMGSVSFVKENVRFILMDAQEVPEDMTHGYVSTNQLAWVEREMKKAADYEEDLIFFTHQLPFPKVLAESEVVNPDNNPYLSGRPRDQEFTIQRHAEGVNS